MNNIYGYDLANPSATPSTLLPDTPELDELRGFASNGTKLYVVNAYKGLNQLLDGEALGCNFVFNDL